MLSSPTEAAAAATVPEPVGRWFLNGPGSATYLFDLLTPAEQAERSNVFDIDLLGRRLADANRWVTDQPDVRDLPFGYFGASTGRARTVGRVRVRSRRARGGVAGAGRISRANGCAG